MKTMYLLFTRGYVLARDYRLTGAWQDAWMFETEAEARKIAAGLSSEVFDLLEIKLHLGAHLARLYPKKENQGRAAA